MVRSLFFGVAFLAAGPLFADEPKKDPPSAEPKQKVSAELPGKDKITWITRGLDDRFTLVKATHVQKPTGDHDLIAQIPAILAVKATHVQKPTGDPEAFESTVVWLLEAKADLTVKPGELDVSLFDEDKVRLRVDEVVIEGGLAVQQPLAAPLPGGGNDPSAIKVLKGERIRVILPTPDKETLDRVKYVVVGSKAVPTEK